MFRRSKKKNNGGSVQRANWGSGQTSPSVYRMRQCYNGAHVYNHMDEKRKIAWDILFP